MSRKAILITVLFVFVIGFAGYKFFSSKTSGSSGLKINSQPAASIFLNDKLIGKTPLETKEDSGEYVLKLIPDDTSTQAASWQGKIQLNPSVQTYVDRDLGESELTSAGEILTLESVNTGSPQLAVFSQPDAGTVLVDGQDRGTAPALFKDIAAGEHEVAVTSPGFITRSIRVQLTNGYKLNASFQLALASPGSPVSSGSSALTPPPDSSGQIAKPYILIKDTPTGFLNVREAPSLTATKSAEVKPGEKYSYLDSQEGWFKISYDSGKEGWISSQYAQKVDK